MAHPRLPDLDRGAFRVEPCEVQVAAFLVLLLFSGVPPFAAAANRPRCLAAIAQPGYQYYLANIEVTGQKRLKRQDVVALTGLKIGRTVNAKDIQVAQARLADSGFFTQIELARSDDRRRLQPDRDLHGRKSHCGRRRSCSTTSSASPTSSYSRRSRQLFPPSMVSCRNHPPSSSVFEQLSSGWHAMPANPAPLPACSSTTGCLACAATVSTSIAPAAP